MASTVDTLAAASTANTQQVTLTFSGVNRGVFAWFGAANVGSANVISATLDGVSVLASVSAVVLLGGKKCYSLKLATALTGACVLQIGWDASDFTFLFASALQDADPDTATWTVLNQGGNDQGTQPNFTFASTGTSDVLIAFLQENSGATLTPSAPAALIPPVNTIFRQAMQRAGTAGATTIAGTYGAGFVRFGVAINIKGAAIALSLTGNITLDDATASGQLGSAIPSSITGNITAGEAIPTGSLASMLSTVTTLPFSRNPGAGARPVSLPNIALAVLTDDANLTRLAGSAALLMGSDGRLQLANGVPAPAGTSVIVLTREPGAAGALGVERYTLT